MYCDVLQDVLLDVLQLNCSWFDFMIDATNALQLATLVNNFDNTYSSTDQPTNTQIYKWVPHGNSMHTK